jgi:hypothetical protein
MFKIIISVIVFVALLTCISLFNDRCNKQQLESGKVQEQGLAYEILLAKKDSLTFFRNKIDEISKLASSVHVVSTAGELARSTSRQQFLESLTDTLPSPVNGIGLLTEKETLIFDREDYFISNLSVYADNEVANIFRLIEDLDPNRELPDTNRMIAAIRKVLDKKYLLIENKIIDIEPEILDNHRYNAGILFKKATLYSVYSNTISQPLKTVFVAAGSSTWLMVSNRVIAGEGDGSSIGQLKNNLERNFRKNLLRKLFRVE